MDANEIQSYSDLVIEVWEQIRNFNQFGHPIEMPEFAKKVREVLEGFEKLEEANKELQESFDSVTADKKELEITAAKVCKAWEAFDSVYHKQLSRFVKPEAQAFIDAVNELE